MNKKRGWLLLIGIIGIGLLCSLGLWQLLRWEAKRDIQEKIVSRQMAPPITLREVLAKIAAREDVAYLHIQDQGRFLYAHNFFKSSQYESASGWEVITPFLSDSGVAILVSRGIIPDHLRPTLSQSNSQDEMVNAILVKHRSTPGLFDQDNEPEKNNWYWWDVPAMLGKASVPAETSITRYVLQILPDATVKPPPYVVEPEELVQNNYLNLAIIFFALAGFLAIIMGFVLYRQRQKQPHS